MGSRILVVEDELITAEDIKETLTSLGYEVTETTDKGETAISIVERERPDLILMDIHLSGNMDGIEAGELIYKKYGIPIVFLTAFGDYDTVKKATSAEPFGYIIKPFEHQDVFSTVEMALRKAEHNNQIKKDHDRMKIISQTTHAGMAIMQNGFFKFCNARLSEILEISEEEILNLPINGLFYFLSKKDQDKIQNSTKNKYEFYTEVQEIEVNINPSKDRAKTTRIFSEKISFENSIAYNLTFIEINKIQEVSQNPSILYSTKLSQDEFMAILETISNPDRFILITSLQAQSLSVPELEFLLKKKQATVYHHLRELEKKNLIRATKQGKYTIYSIIKSSFMSFWAYWKQFYSEIQNWNDNL